MTSPGCAQGTAGRSPFGNEQGLVHAVVDHRLLQAIGQRGDGTEAQALVAIEVVDEPRGAVGKAAPGRDVASVGGV